mgnify:CR=1 FL=1|jgi:predicted aconitase
MRLTKEEKEVLAGDQGEARRFCMELICKSAELRGAETLIPIESAYVGTAWYSGQAQMDFVLRLHSSGAKVSVTTLTAASRVCLADNRLNSDPKIESASRQLAQKLVDIGCLPTFSCSPYNDGHRPKFGSCVAWTESSAVVFANSVLGARACGHLGFLLGQISDSNSQNGGLNERAAVCGVGHLVAAA